MNLIKVTIATARLIPSMTFFKGDDEYGPEHLAEMCEKIIAGEVTGEKAHRWLGWVQCALCIGGVITLDELKKLNADA